MTRAQSQVLDEPVAVCAERLLRELGWQGTQGALLEILPHEQTRLDAVDLRNILAELGWVARRHRHGVRSLSPDACPLLLETRDGSAALILDIAEDRIRIFDTQHGDRWTSATTLAPGRLWRFVPAMVGPASAGAEAWWRSVCRRFHREIASLVAVAIIGALSALVVPGFAVLVFDLVLPAADAGLLAGLAIGAVAILAIDLAHGVLRTRLHARLSARFGRIAAVAVFRRLLDLAPAALENARVRVQVARLRQFDQVRDLMSQPVLGSAIDLATSLVLWLVLLTAVGWPALVPLAVMLIAASLAAAHLRPLDRALAALGDVRERRDGHLDELVHEASAIRLLAAERIWVERTLAAGASTAAAGLALARLNRRLQLVGVAAGHVSGYVTLFLLAHHCIAGELSPGLLMGGSYLVWRVVAPLQQALAQLPRIVRLARDVQMLEQFMRLPGEADQRPASPLPRRHEGRLRLENVGFTYGPGVPPALLGINLEVGHGELIGIHGPSGAGKTTLLKATMDMVQPQVGRILLDGIDLRQLNPRELRSTFAYLPQRPALYSGTIEQNLRLGSLEASRGDLAAACAAAGVLKDIEALANGFATRLHDLAVDDLPAGFVRRLCLARTYLRRAPIVLLDEPGRSLDRRADQHFRAWLQAIRRTSTVLFVSVRPSHLALADRVVRIEFGRIVDITPRPSGPTASDAKAAEAAAA